MVTTRPVAIGDTVTIEMPFSEVCMHMRVAGRRMAARLQPDRRLNGTEVPDFPMVQLVSADGSDFSSPILPGEAGIYGDVRDGFYVHVTA